MATIERKYYQEYIEFLIKNKIKHTITYTGRSYKVKSAIGNCEFINSVFSLKALGFMSKVRSHILKKETYKNVRDGEFKRMKLINMSGADASSKHFKNCVEFDLNKAYWRGALKAKVIDQDLYDEGINSGLTKIELLATIGAMAKTVRSRFFDGADYKKAVVLTDSEVTRHIWRAVSWQIDRCMQECAQVLAKEEFLFYWTDAVFFHNTVDNRRLVQSVVEKHGFDCKAVKIEYLSRNKHGQIIAWTKHNKSNAQDEQMLRDGYDNYGRVFVYVNNKKTVNQEIQEMLNKINLNKNGKV